MNKKTIEKIISHPDKDEIISKLVIGIPSKDIYEWLDAKYSNVSEKKFVIAEKTIKSFKKNYLDVYQIIQEDLLKTKQAQASDDEDILNSITNNTEYKNILLKTAEKELDIREIVHRLAIAIETRLGQVFDELQSDPRNMNSRVDRVLIEYANTLANITEKYHKFTEAPEHIGVQNNITLQVVDQHISVFHDVIKKILSSMDIDTSLKFMEMFNEEMSKLKPQDNKITPTEHRLAEAEVLHETINKKLNP